MSSYVRHRTASEPSRRLPRLLCERTETEIWERWRNAVAKHGNLSENALISIPSSNHCQPHSWASLRKGSWNQPSSMDTAEKDNALAKCRLGLRAWRPKKPMLCLHAVTEEDGHSLENEDESGRKLCEYWCTILKRALKARGTIAKIPSYNTFRKLLMTYVGKLTRMRSMSSWPQKRNPHLWRMLRAHYKNQVSYWLTLPLHILASITLGSFKFWKRLSCLSSFAVSCEGYLLWQALHTWNSQERPENSSSWPEAWDKAVLQAASLLQWHPTLFSAGSRTWLSQGTLVLLTSFNLFHALMLMVMRWLLRLSGNWRPPSLLPSQVVDQTAGLNLNNRKSLLHRVATNCEEFREMKVAKYAKYVGTMIGPEGHVHRWTAPRKNRAESPKDQCLRKKFGGELVRFKNLCPFGIVSNWIHFRTWRSNSQRWRPMPYNAPLQDRAVPSPPAGCVWAPCAALDPTCLGSAPLAARHVRELPLTRAHSPTAWQKSRLRANMIVLPLLPSAPNGRNSFWFPPRTTAL